MTIDEAIKRYVDNANYERTHGNLQGCLEFKQLVKWMKELKQLREQTKHAHWTEKYVGGMFLQACSNCNAHAIIKSNYCPNCGAKMDENDRTLEYADQDTMMSAT